MQRTKCLHGTQIVPLTHLGELVKLLTCSCVILKDKKRTYGRNGQGERYALREELGLKEGREEKRMNKTDLTYSQIHTLQYSSAASIQILIIVNRLPYMFFAANADDKEQ